MVLINKSRIDGRMLFVDISFCCWSKHSKPDVYFVFHLRFPDGSDDAPEFSGGLKDHVTLQVLGFSTIHENSVSDDSL